MYNRIASRFIFSVLDVRDWSETKFAKDSKVARSVLSTHLCGSRRIQPNHLAKYLNVLDHQEQPRLVAAWLRDNFPEEVTEHLLNATGDDLAAEVREFVPPLEDEARRMLAWLAREMARDGELADLFKGLTALAGYRPRNRSANEKRRRN